MKLSKNFTLAEFTRSAEASGRGIDNTPTPGIISNLEKLCTQVLQPARDAIGPIRITSGYRSPQLNLCINGAPGSQHLKGQAADLQAADNAELFNTLRTQGNFDQLIWEFGDDIAPRWVHVSFAEIPRGEVLRCTIKDGKRVYYKI